jgi:microcystin-dependent protein
MAASGNPHNTIPVVPGDRLATRARFRLGNPGISTWHDGARAAVIMRWVDAAGNYIGGTFGWSSHASKTITAAQAGIWFELSSQTTIPATVSGVVPAGVRMGWHFSDSTYNIPANRRAYFDKFLVEKTANPAGAYFDGSFADTATVSYDWVTASGPTDSARTSTETTKLTTTSTPGLATAAQFPVRAGRDYTVSAATMMLPAPDADTGPLVTAELRWYDASHNPLTPATTAATFPSRVTGAWQRQGVTVTTPASAAFATLAIYPASLGPVDAFYVDAVMVEAGTTMGSFIVGQVTTGGLPYIPPVSWVDILGAAHDITVSRQSLNVGTMAASVLDANLDPSRDDLLHPGRRVRLMALSYGGDWQPVFTGTISQAEVTYDPQIPAPRRARITLSAVDALATLANIARDEGVGRIADLPYVLEGCGVPWDVNGSGNQVPTAVVVARNDSTSALDQVALTRDSAQGIAWLDRYGTLHAYDDTGGYVGVVTMLDEGVYSDIDISFNTSAVINEVNLNVQRYNPGTGDTEEVPYGPYVDADSVAEWGAFSAEFRVQGVTETTSNLAAWAQAVLDANGTPVRRINAMTLPITEPEHVDVTRALLDLENLTGTQNLAADLMDNLRIQSIEHRITTTTWVMSIGFGVDGQVAQPTFTPAPGNTSGLTLNELLRPVGEVTMFYGAKSDIPAGWLPLDGSPFSSTTYPKLFDLLGTATLPNMADQFPIGAGTKALGTTGGSPTKTLTAAQMAHTHGISSQSDHQHGISGQDADTSPLSGGSGSGSAVRNSQYGGHAHGTATGNAGQHSHGGATAGVTLGSPTAVDVMNPWRSLWFIIRAL